jgi:uncharacterized protein
VIPALWALLALFALRVLGQMLVAFFGVSWLPPMERWYSGLMPYEYLLPSQLLILAFMAKICTDFTRGRGFFVRPRRFFAVHWVLAAFVILVGLWHRRRLRA